MDHPSAPTQGSEGQEVINNLESLLQSCESIIETSLSFRTLASPTGDDDDDEEDAIINAENNNSDNLQSLIRRETRISKWLERQILDLEARMNNNKKPSPSPSSATNSTTPASRRTITQGQLDDATARLDLERMLLTRINRSNQATEAIFGGETYAKANAAPGEQERKDILLDAIQSRDNQAVESLYLNRQLQTIRQQVRTASENCTTLQRNNRRQWKQLKTKRNDNKNKKHQDSATTTTTDNNKVQDENIVLKRMIVDLISVSGIDWYQDDRLRDIMMRLTTDVG